MIYTIRTTSGREDIVVDLLMSKINADGIDVKSVFHPAEIKGYVFIEGSVGAVHKAIQGLMHSRGLIDKPIQMGEIQHFLQHKTARIRVDEDDIVEIIGGPFKGEKGRVKRINKIKDEVTAELLEASIPIPVTIATEFVKVIKKAHPERMEAPVAREEEEDDGKSVFDKEELAKVGEERKPGEGAKEGKSAFDEEPDAEPEKAPAEEKPAAAADEEKAGEQKEEKAEPQVVEEEDIEEELLEELSEEEKKKKKKEEEDYE